MWTTRNRKFKAPNQNMPKGIQIHTSRWAWDSELEAYKGMGVFYAAAGKLWGHVCEEGKPDWQGQISSYEFRKMMQNTESQTSIANLEEVLENPDAVKIGSVCFWTKTSIRK